MTTATIKIQSLKEATYQLASKLLGHKVNKTKQIKRLTEGLDLRKKADWIKAFSLIEEMLDDRAFAAVVSCPNTSKLLPVPTPIVTLETVAEVAVPTITDMYLVH